MKSYYIVASKEIVATFRMEYDVYKMKFDCTTDLVSWIVDNNPRLKGIPNATRFEAEEIIVDFYSLGDLVIEESII